LSEDTDGFLSTNNGIITSTINVESLSTGVITTQAMYFNSDSGGVIAFTLNNVPAAILGIFGETYDFNILSLANLNLEAPNIKINGTLDLVDNEITNVNQTVNLSSATTNVMARRVYFDSAGRFDIDSTTYSNVLTTTQANPPIYNNPKNFYKYLNCTFSFRCDNFINDLGYYFELSNTTRSLTNLTGKIFTNVYPYMENENIFLSGNHSISVQEQFDANTWTNGDKFLPMMFVKSKSGSGTLCNMEFSMVYEPLIEYYP